MIPLSIHNESNTLQAVILGIADDSGGVPRLEDAYDPKSLEHIFKGSYPTEDIMLQELHAFKKVLEKYHVTVYRPRNITSVNQIFTRDIGFVIENKFIKSNILPNRSQELQAIDAVLNQINPKDIISLPSNIHIEGGDVVLWNEFIFIGTYKGANYKDLITARTNPEAVAFIQFLFPHKKVISFDLIKSNTNARANALHLDCCFQPIGLDKAIVYPNGFKNPADFEFLLELFGQENTFQITAEEMYQMYSNVFSISPKIIVSEIKFTRLNQWLLAQNFIVEEISYSEISKQEGLLRCSTLPLQRI